MSDIQRNVTRLIGHIKKNGYVRRKPKRKMMRTDAVFTGEWDMKLCFVAPASNYHTIKWCNWFVAHGHEVHVVSFIDADIQGVKVHFIDSGVQVQDSDFSKLKYLLQFKKLRKIIESINPDVVNVHYATSYGITAALSGVRGYTLSVWGSDVFSFPQKTILHKWILQFSLLRAKYLFSTSRAMAEECRKYTKKEIAITPFGVNTELFSPQKRTRPTGDKQKFVVGTVKGLKECYGIDVILKAINLIKKERNDIPLQVRIAGDGPNANEYRELAEQLGIADIVEWLGFISQEEAAKVWANLDVALIPSREESFGVSSVEAQASGVPVIISNVAGLVEATCPEATSLMVEPSNEEQLAESIVRLYDDAELCKRLGVNGRKFVLENYELEACFRRVENLFFDRLQR